LHPAIGVPPRSNSTVPPLPTFKKVVKVTGVPTFSGAAGHASKVTLEADCEGVTEAELVDAGPVPPALVATTLKVAATPATKPGTTHDVLGDDTVQVSPPGLDVTV